MKTNFPRQGAFNLCWNMSLIYIWRYSLISKYSVKLGNIQYVSMFYCPRKESSAINFSTWKVSFYPVPVVYDRNWVVRYYVEGIVPPSSGRICPELQRTHTTEQEITIPSTRYPADKYHMEGIVGRLRPGPISSDGNISDKALFSEEQHLSRASSISRLSWETNSHQYIRLGLTQ